MRRSARETGLGAFATSLTALASDGELSGGRLRLDYEPTFELSPTIVMIPYEPTLVEDRLGLRLELTLGYIRGSTSGPLLDSLVHVDTQYDVVSGEVGVGPSLWLPGGFRVQPLLQLGLAYVSNHTDYRGPLADFASDVFDGVVLNIDGLYGNLGGSFAIRQNEWSLGCVDLGLLLRYDLRRTFVLDLNKDADDEPLTSHWLTARFDLRGPIGSLHEWALSWLASVGYRRHLGDLAKTIEIDDYFAFGLGVAVSPPGPLRPGPLEEVRLKAAYYLGEDLEGWALGVSLGF